tara:strand:- start:549 stop:731 length:183 start_codon:yes stop_codon:yes gene_type:complete
VIATVQYAYPDGPTVQGELVRRWIEPRREKNGKVLEETPWATVRVGNEMHTARLVERGDS